ncbi:short-chain dehydrogenase/reductase-like protein [Hypomontagnella monticulosa]|nr:short-chain dehydrogenase/reductase-like protein [Hypomontagnella monticulosa]
MNRSLSRAFWTQIMPLPIPTADFTSKTIIITGANVGIGLEAARYFVRLSAEKVILGCRDLDKANEAKRDIESTEGKIGVIEVWHVDLSSFDSVKGFCLRASTLDRLDIVIENAGLLATRYEAFEGYERQITVNVISTYLMAMLLLPTMRRTMSMYQDRNMDDVPHLVIVGSNGHFYAHFKQRSAPSIFDALKDDSDMYERYRTSKVLSVLFARELANRMSSSGKPSTILNVVDPGFCQSNLLRDKALGPIMSPIMAFLMVVFARTAEKGARTYIMAACAGIESHGKYLEDCELSTPSSFVESDEGSKVQVRVFDELVGILEGISPGISGNI